MAPHYKANLPNFSSTGEVTDSQLTEFLIHFLCFVSAVLKKIILKLLNNFSIEKPWYLKPLAIASYVLLALAIIFIIHYFNKRYYKRQKQKLIEKKQRELELEQLQNQRQIIQFKNENLQLDIENKNRELGTATMNLVKRNELLNNIKEELTRSKSTDDVKRVIRMVNSSLNNTSDWKLFEEAFNNTDKDFIKTIAPDTWHTNTTQELPIVIWTRLFNHIKPFLGKKSCFRLFKPS